MAFTPALHGPLSRTLRVGAAFSDVRARLPRIMSAASLKGSARVDSTDTVVGESGASLLAWGERVEAQVIDEGDYSRIKITSSPKSKFGTCPHDRHFRNVQQAVVDIFGTEGTFWEDEGSSDRLAAVRKQIEQLPGGSKFLSRKELEELPSILSLDEAALDLVLGIYSNANGLLVATDRRLIFVDKGLVRLKVEDFPLDTVTSIQFETGMLFGTIKIMASGNTAKITQVDKIRARSFAEGVRERLSESKTGGEVGSDAVPSVADEIEKLHNLREKGILSDIEFDAKKKQLLGL